LEFKNDYESKLDSPSIKLIYGKGNKENYQAIADLINYIQFYNDNKNNIKDDEELDDYWPEYKMTLKYIYNKYLPFFKLKSSRNEKNKNINYFIDRGGLLGDDLKKFLEFYPLKNIEIKKRQPNKVIDKKEKKIVEINDFKVTLDDNWSKNDSLGFPSYWLESITKRDSQIGVEKNIWENIKGNMDKDLFSFVRYGLLFRKDYIVLNSLKVIEKENYISISYILNDENNFQNLIRADYYLINDKIYIVNFSTFLTMYEKNIDYYQDIFNSVKIK
jgi:hypothetical protein